ncbi:MAG: TPM domain-containing protein [Clostridia bacterium]|nr:TPM domain-containing protein [Clostridia bacterium]
MKNRNKRRFSLLAVILAIVVFCPILMGAAPEPTADFFVNDYAGVLSPETEQEIQNTAVTLYNDTTAQVCVLTVQTLDGEDISEYSVEVFREWGIGDKEKDNGVLIVLSVSDREMWITTGYGVEGTLTDVVLGQMRDTYAIPHYSQDDFDTGTQLLFGAIVNELRTEEYGLEPDENSEYYQNNPYENDMLTRDDSEGMFIFLAVWALLIILPGISWLYTTLHYLKLLSYDKKHGTTRAAEYKSKLARRKLRHISTHHGGHHHGGFGGGFGGGGFRGGGGSTGGGGAGGRF